MTLQRAIEIGSILEAYYNIHNDERLYFDIWDYMRACSTEKDTKLMNEFIEELADLSRV